MKFNIIFCLYNRNIEFEFFVSDLRAKSIVKLYNIYESVKTIIYYNIFLNDS